MSVLNVENVTHGVGSRRILENVSFRLLKVSMSGSSAQTVRASQLF